MTINRISAVVTVVLSLLLISTVGGCAFVDENITLQPTSVLPPSAVGSGQRVGVNVVDERTTSIIGRRGPMRSAEIQAAQDVRKVVDNAVNQGMRNQGFVPVPYTKAEPVTLEVQVREFSYDTSTGFFTGGIHTRAALKAIARRSEDGFEEMYRTEEEDRVIVVPTEASDAERLNLVLSHTIDQMLADQRLLSPLYAPPCIGDL